MRTLLKRIATISVFAILLTSSVFAQSAGGNHGNHSSAATNETSSQSGDHGGGHGGGHDDHGLVLKYGRYKGKLRLPARKSQLNAVLDLFLVQEHDEYPKLKGILKVSVGGFQSSEYLTYVYEKISFDPDKKTLTFGADSEDILLTNVMVHGDMLMGTYRVQSANAEGPFTLDFDRPFNVPEESTAPGGPSDGGGNHGDHSGHTGHTLNGALASQVVPSLAGEYAGQCDGRQVLLQLDTRRSRGGAGLGSNPFNQYEITGRLGTLNDLLGTIKSVIYHDGTFDPFSGALTLAGEPESMTCQVDTTGNMTCGKCQLSRKSSFEELVGFSPELPIHERSYRLPRQGHPIFTEEPKAWQISGTYSGYLHHERSGLYQPVSLVLDAYYYSDRMHAPNQLYVTGQFELGFEGGAATEKVVYRLGKRPWLFSKGAMVLKGAGDGFGVVREWRAGLLIVDWYSTVFGRVGTMELVQGQLPTLPSGLRVVKGLSGTYIGPIYHLTLSLSPVASADDQPFNPYRLLKISGGTRVRGTGPFNEIAGGVYDYYSGTISLDSKGAAYYLGKVDQEGIKLFITGYNMVTYPVLPFELGLYSPKK